MLREEHVAISRKFSLVENIAIFCHTTGLQTYLIQNITNVFFNEF